MAHFAAVAAACIPVPFYLYEIEARAGYALTHAVVSAVQQRAGNLVGINVSDPDLDDVVAYMLPGLDVLVGTESLIADAVARGAVGTVSGLAAALHTAVVEAYRLRLSSAQVGSLRAGFNRHPFQSALKTALVLQGVVEDAAVRPPMRRLTQTSMPSSQPGLTVSCAAPTVSVARCSKGARATPSASISELDFRIGCRQRLAPRVPAKTPIRMNEASSPIPATAPSGESVPIAVLAATPFRRVRKAYEQVADQLRDSILAGDLEAGTRLPTEQALAQGFGVSRATVREALRILVTQNLVRTANGADGGSYVSRPTVDHISEFLRANIGLLSQTHDVSLEEFLEARECLEVPAVRLATQRHSPGDVERLTRAIPETPGALGITEQFSYNKDFHSLLVQMSGNTLLAIATQPVFSVLQTNLARSALGQSVHQRINHDHRKILAAVESRDPVAAEDEMRQHLAYLRPQYERAWRHALHRAGT